MITLTQEQIEAGRAAAMRRGMKWKPMPQAAVALAHNLFREHGHLRPTVECVEVAKVAGTSNVQVRERYLCGEFGLPTPNVERALAFAAGKMTYTRADGSIRRVNDDMDYHHDRAKWVGRCAAGKGGAAFPGLTGEDYGRMWDACGGRCPCCHVEMDGATSERQPTVDHLVPGFRDKSNARLICRGCNRIKQDALPWMIHRVADWMELSPAQMIGRARALPEMGRKREDWRGDRRKVMLHGKKSGAKEKGIEFSLTLEDVAWSASCPVFGVPFLLSGSPELKDRGIKAQAWDSPNFDRIDPRKGYIPGNVVLVCTLANAIMSDATSPARVRQVADWFDRELAAAPELAALIDQDDARAHWLMAAE